MRRGLYRIRGIDGLPDEVRVDDDGIEVPLEERLYNERNYLPPVADLPWQEEYTKKPAEDLPDPPSTRTRVGSGVTLADMARWGSSAGASGRKGTGMAFRSRVGPIKK